MSFTQLKNIVTHLTKLWPSSIVVPTSQSIIVPCNITKLPRPRIEIIIWQNKLFLCQLPLLTNPANHNRQGAPKSKDSLAIFGCSNIQRLHIIYFIYIGNVSKLNMAFAEAGAQILKYSQNHFAALISRVKSSISSSVYDGNHASFSNVWPTVWVTDRPTKRESNPSFSKIPDRRLIFRNPYGVRMRSAVSKLTKNNPVAALFRSTVKQQQRRTGYSRTGSGNCHGLLSSMSSIIGAVFVGCHHGRRRRRRSKFCVLFLVFHARWISHFLRS